MATRNPFRGFGWGDPLYWVLVVVLVVATRHYIELFDPDLPWYYRWVIQLPVVAIVMWWISLRIERRSN